MSGRDPFAVLEPLARALLAEALVATRRQSFADATALPRHARLAAALDAALGGHAGGAAGNVDATARRIRDTAPALDPHVALLLRCGRALPSVLAGEVAGTDLLFPRGTMDLVAPLYDGTEWSDRFNARLAEAAARAAVALAAAGRRPVRVVEIGAGTGGTTRHVLPALARAGVAVDYAYTDVSPGFLAHGRRRFPAVAGPELRFAVLDIERDPGGQGFAAGSADIVIATNVLHATARIADSLGHVAAMLAPGGVALVNEITRPSLFATMTFGLLDGWWRFADPGRRLPHAPLLDVPRWRAVMTAAGLGDPVAIGWDAAGDADGFQVLLIADRLAAPRRLPLITAPAVPAADAPTVAGAVTAAVADVLGLDPAEIDSGRPFAELGVDSIVAGQLAAALTERLGVALPPSALYDHATVVALTAHVAALGAKPSDAPAAPRPSPLPAATDVADTDVAVIGIACRFPGAADRQHFWRNLVDGVDSVTEIPAGRRSVGRWGGFLDGHDLFDPDAFRLTPAEAAAMSPQQRVFLEGAWHALEDAGYGREELEGRAVGLFVGVAPDGYGGDRADARSSLGDSNAILSARLAYLLDLKGAALPIDTACSSSLVAVHMAARALIDGDLDMALAGGVSILMRGPRLHAFLADSGMASPTGRCRAFDAGADGFVPGEGMGVVVLKRLDRAGADGDAVIAVLKGSGVNQDGRTSGITAPSGPAQTALIRRVMSRHGLDPAAVGLVEAHGTGTRLGDPIEVNALARAYGPSGGPTPIGSVKSNIGHTLTAAGIAGFIKAALAVRVGIIPPSLHFEHANPELDLTAGRFRVPVRAEPWSAPDGRPRIAAVSSFGFSGTNAHAVLAQAPDRPEPRFAPGPRPIVLSARSPEQLRRRAAELADAVAAGAGPLPWIAFTLAVGRTHGEHRLALRVEGCEDLVEALRAVAAGLPTPAATPAEEADGPLADFLGGGNPALAPLFPPAERGRVHLPGTPFDRRPFAQPPVRASAVAVLHPLIAENLSDAHGLRFRLAGTAGWPGLADHRNAGRPILAAAAILLAFLEAGRLALRTDGLELAEVGFLRPVPVDRAAEAVVAVEPDGAGGWAAVLLDADGGPAARALLRDASAAASGTLDVQPAGRLLAADTVYPLLAAVGFDYGPGFRSIDGLAVAEGRVVARLRQPEQDGFGWHPAVLDGAIQAAVGLALDRLAGADVTVIPAGLATARLTGDPADVRFAVVTERPGGNPDRPVLDIALTDEAGGVLARLDGLAVALVRRSAVAADGGPLAFEASWRVLPPAAAVRAAGEVAVVLGAGQQVPLGFDCPVVHAPEDGADWAGALAGLDPRPAALIDLRGLAAGAPARAAADVLPLLAGWMRALPGVPLSVLRAAVDDGRPCPETAALEGIAATLRHEAPELRLRAVGIGGGGELAAILRAELGRDGPDYVRIVAGRRLGRVWRQAESAAADPLPQNPVVLVTGAGGGLGRIVARHLAAGRGARLVLAGRRDGGTLSDLARELAGTGTVAVEADVATPEGAGRAVAAARSSFGRLDAIVHAAGVTGDGLLRTRGPTDLEAVFAVKVDSLRLLLAAAAAEPVVSILAFGSLAAVFGNAGQGLYAAANAAMAGLAEREGLPLTVVDWPFWRTGGMRGRDADDARLRAATGSRWIAPEEGLALLDRALAAGVPRLAVAAGDGERVAAAFGSASRAAVVDVPTASAPPESLGTQPGMSIDVAAVLRAVLGEVLGFEPGRLSDERAIEDLHLDSMHVMALNDRLAERFDGVPPTLFYAHRTIGAVADALAALTPRRTAAVAATAPSPAPSPPAPLPPAPAILPVRSRVEARPAGTVEPIAIVGMAGRFPGAPDLDAFWALLRDGRSAVTEIPPGRWDVERFHDPRPATPGRSYSRWGGFIDGVELFDPLHFGIAPADALRMDPQERLVLEVAAAALEDAGLTRASLAPDPDRAGSVHVGVMYGDYQLIGAEQHARGNPVPAAAPYWSIANRLSYWLDLHGPSLAVDSACSSSLTAIHMACRTLWSGEAQVALAGAVNLSLHPLKYVGLSAGRFASTDGLCRSFAEGGDGYVPGEGVAIVVLKPLAAALADGDPIRGVIRGSAVAHGGRTNGYTVPSPEAQAAAIRAALDLAGVPAGRLGFLEAHGTGTALGDPIELDGIVRAAGTRAAPLPFGTVKAAIGHLEAAAGMAGLARVLLQFRHDTLAPTLMHGRPSPALTAAGALRLVTAAEPWEPGEEPRLAGISSFGAGGTNAHLLVEEPPARPLPLAAEGPFGFVFSGRNRAQLEAEVDGLLPLLAAAGDAVSSADLACSLQLGREPLAARLGLLAANGAEAARMLSDWRAGRAVDGMLLRIPDDEDADAAVPASSAGLPQALRSWVAGAAVDWRTVGAAGRRIGLPARPLLRRRIWPDTAGPGVAAPAPPARGLDMRFEAGDPLLAEHRVDGRPLLPGAAAVVLLAGRDRRGLDDVRFLRPVRPTAGRPAVVLECRVETGVVRLEAAGEAVASARLAGGDGLEAIPAPAAGTDCEPDGIYRGLAALGLDYGGSFRRLAAVRSDGVLAEAALQAASAGDPARRLVLDLDAVFQTAAALQPAGLTAAGIPAEIAQVRWIGDDRPVASARARRQGDGRFDLDGLDAAGRPVFQLRGLRVLQPARRVEPRLLAPAWSERFVIGPPQALGTVVLAHGRDESGLVQRLSGRLRPAAVLPLDGDDPEALVERALRACAAAQTLILLDDAPAVPPACSAALATRAARLTEAAGAVARGLARLPAGTGPERLLVLTVNEAGGDSVTGAGLVGLARSLAAERRGLSLALVGIDHADLPGTESIDRVLAEPFGPLPRPRARWTGGRRFEERLVAAAPEAAPPLPALPAGAVCLVTGGAGGLGRALAGHLVARHGARVVLSGRRASVQGRLPDGVTYLSADVADAAAVAAAVTRVVATHGRLDAVFHLALVLRDGRLTGTSAADFAAPLAPKAVGTANVLAAAARAGAGRAVMFSSANAFAGVDGQANYVAGSCLQDAIAGAWPGPMRVQTIDWGLWGEVGAVADPATQARLRRAGIHPILPADGLRIVDLVLGRDISRLAAVAAEPHALAGLGWSEDGDDTGDLAGHVAAFRALERYGLARLAAILAEALGEAAGRAQTPAALLRLLEVAPPRHRLFAALVDALARAGLAAERDGVVRLPAAGVDPAVAQAAAEAALVDAPGWIAGPRALLDATLARYPGMLAGRIDPLTVLFPGGRGDTVADAYRGNPVSDGFNAAAAAAVAEAGGAVPGAVIVEVGGGTGGGTRAVLDALAAAPGALPSRYLFTDVSRRFLERAAAELGPGRPWFETALYDAERPAEENGLRPGVADVVVATNMLHAAADLPAALRELGRLLKPGGRLVVNELIANQDFGTLVFGLTDGWWRGAGAPERLPHGPLVGVDGWRALLAAAGYSDIRVIDLAGRRADGQAVIVATAPAEARTAWRPASRLPAEAVSETPAGAADAGLRGRLVAALRSIVAGQLGLDPADLRAGEPFDRYGLESLSAMAIRDAIDARFGGVSQTLLFEHDTLAALADHLLAYNSAAVQAALGVGSEPAPTPIRAAGTAPADIRPIPAPAGDDAVAIIGMAGRFPGAADPAALWRLLEAGGSALGPVPAERWPDGWFDPAGGGGRSYTRIGGFLPEIDCFDPLYFGISPADAEALDPQERLFLETAWHALEDAGSTPARLQARSGPVGVYVGVMNAGYQWLAAQQAAGGPAPATSSYWSIANRLSYVANLLGPSLAVDTACSSSLTALHLAVEALRRGDCGAAVVGGVNLIVHPRQLGNLSEARMLSPSGDCRAFGADADGFVDGEGVVALMLKPLAAALRDGDRVEAVILGTALNAGGRTSGFSVPSPTAQARVAAEAMARAGIEPASVDVVETHGTGTSLGDPIEATGLAQAYGGTGRQRPLWIGALKANIGHLEAAAGVAGVAKAVLQLRHRRIAPLRHAAALNPRIDLEACGLAVPATAIDWPAPPDGTRRIGVSSFGAGGANAHVVMQEAPARDAPVTSVLHDLLVLSGADRETVERTAARLVDALDACADLSAALHTLRVGRRACAYRVAVPVAGPRDVRAALQSLAGGRLPDAAAVGSGPGGLARLLEETAAGAALVAERLAAGDVDALARLWCEGAEVDWDRLPWVAGLVPVALPATLFRRERYWLAATPATGIRPSDAAAPVHEVRFLEAGWFEEPAEVAGSAAGPWLLAGGPPALAAGAAQHLGGPASGWRRPDWNDLIDRLPAASGGDLVVLLERMAGADAAGEAHDLALAAIDGLSAVLARPGRVRRVLLATDAGAPAVEALTALALSAAQEGLDVRIRVVTIPEAATVAELSGLLAEERAAGAPGAGLVRRTGGRRLVRRLSTADAPAAGGPVIGPGCRVLMVGGLGAVGTALAREMTGVLGARVAVIGRRPRAAAVPPDLASLVYHQADVTDAAALRGAVDAVAAELGGIDVVLHLARVVDNAPLAVKDRSRAAAVLAVKTAGTRALEAALAGREIRAFVTFSSLAAWFGLAGGADYAAACAAQDALMAAPAPGPGRRLSIAWPQWAYDEELDAGRLSALRTAGFGTIDAARGIALLERALAGSAAAMAIVIGRSDVLDGLVDSPAADPLAGLSDEALQRYVDTLRALDAAADRPAPEDLAPEDPAPVDPETAIRAAVARHLKVDPARLAPSTVFADLGLDSIKALHVAETVAGALGVEVEPVLLVEHPTIATLAAALRERLSPPLREAGE